MRQSAGVIKLVVGLGNPGREYESTRHNVGFMVVNKLLAGFPAGRFEESSSAESRLFTGRLRGKELALQMPQTYMNLSGKAVALYARRNQIKPEEILVISDDLDLPLGRIRLRAGGSDGGHNGLKSIIAELGSASFKRLRIGIGHQESGTTADYVLGSFSTEETPVLNEVLERAAEAVNCVLSAGMSCAMNKYNVKPQQIEKETETTL
ncbi:MAG: aminoacyl-tRNA hydrolase [Lentisphaeria bacterium]|nr:aminoacyl-tRNA hydrolase [Lentisphaeria bacterium]